MASITQSTAESADSDVNNDENGISAPQPITSRYVSVQALHRLVKDAIGAAENLTMDDTDAATVKWAQAIEARLYEQDGSLGELQSEMTDYTTGEFKDTYGDSITTDHADLEPQERDHLKELLGDSENHQRSDANGEFKLPVVNGERVPVLVADMDVLEEGIEMLDAIVAEFDNGAASNPYAVDDDEICGAETADGSKCGRSTAGGTCWQHSDDEGGDDNGADSTPDEVDDDEATNPYDDDNDAGSTTSDVDTEELAETVSTAVTAAVLEALDN